MIIAPPRPPAIMIGIAACVAARLLIRLRSIWRAQFFGCRSTKARRVTPPALLTRISSRPNCFAVSATAACSGSTSITLIGNCSARRPRFSTCSAVSAQRSGITSTMATSAPMSAMHSAQERPMPPPPPVTKATCPVRSISLASIVLSPQLFFLRNHQPRCIGQILRHINIARQPLAVHFLDSDPKPIGLGMMFRKAVRPEAEGKALS